MTILKFILSAKVLVGARRVSELCGFAVTLDYNDRFRFRSICDGRPRSILPEKILDMVKRCKTPGQTGTEY
jgi:hypothetical protein